MVALFPGAFHHYGAPVEPPAPSFGARIVLAWVAFFRILFDGAFAGRVDLVKESMPALPPPAQDEREKRPKKAAPPAAKEIDVAAVEARARRAGALWVLGALQREGRFVDFLEGDVTTFGDDEVGAAARVVHAGCKRALGSVLGIEPIRSEKEGATITLEAGYAPAEHKLTGDVKGEAPFEGVLKHKGWRAKDVKLPTPTKGDDPTVLAPAEIEL
jgi:hypothetical protein